MVWRWKQGRVRSFCVVYDSWEWRREEPISSRDANPGQWRTRKEEKLGTFAYPFPTPLPPLPILFLLALCSPGCASRSTSHHRPATAEWTMEWDAGCGSRGIAIVRRRSTIRKGRWKARRMRWRWVEEKWWIHLFRTHRRAEGGPRSLRTPLLWKESEAVPRRKVTKLCSCALLDMKRKDFFVSFLQSPTVFSLSSACFLTLFVVLSGVLRL